MTPDEERKLIDNLTPEEIAEAKESLRRYFEIGWAIATRLKQEDPERFEAVVLEARQLSALDCEGVVVP